MVGNSMKKNFFGKLIIPALVIFAVILFISAGGSEKQDKPFNWTLALLNVKTGETLPFSAPIQSGTGEQFRVILNPDSACFAYVIAESSGSDDVAVLFSGPLKANEVWYSPDLVLSPPSGSESLFIVTSKGEQTDLAQRISAFNGNPGVTQRRALMNEVMRIRSGVSQFRESPEKPVLMGAATRGNPNKVEGVEFSGLDTYVKTISIEH